MTGVSCAPCTIVHPALKVTKCGTSARVRTVSRVGGCSTNQILSVHNASIDNLACGVLQRVLYVKVGDKFEAPPLPRRGVFGSRMKLALEAIERTLPPTTPVSRQEFAMLYKGRKQSAYLKAVESLESLPVRVRDSYVTVFTKSEKTNFSLKPDAVPRVVSPRSKRYNVEIGRYIKPYEHRYCEAIDALYGHKTVFKGLNATMAGQTLFEKWCMFTSPVAVGLDAHRYDTHVSVPALKWEHEVLMSPFHGPDREELASLLKWQLSYKCFGYCRDGKLKYSVKGKRCSGDMNTGIGNCIVMSSMVWSFCRSAGIRKFQLANNGDDCVVILEKGELSRFSDSVSQWFHEMGFNMKVEKPVYIFERIEFCQQNPLFDGYHYRMVRNPRVSMEKDSVSLKKFTNHNSMVTWCKAVGDAGMSLTGGIPVVQDFYQAFQRMQYLGKHRRTTRIQLDPTFETGMSMLAKGMKEHYRPPTSEARYSFYLATGMTPDHQESVENQLRVLELSFDTVPIDVLPSIVM